MERHVPAEHHAITQTSLQSVKKLCSLPCFINSRNPYVCWSQAYTNYFQIWVTKPSFSLNNWSFRSHLLRRRASEQALPWHRSQCCWDAWKLVPWPSWAHHSATKGWKIGSLKHSQPRYEKQRWGIQPLNGEQQEKWSWATPKHELEVSPHQHLKHHWGSGDTRNSLKRVLKDVK